MTVYAMTPGECLTTGGHAILHGRCVNCGHQRGSGRRITPPKRRKNGRSSPATPPPNGDQS